MEALVSSIPALKREVRLRELIGQAEKEGALGKRGTTSWISEMSGFNYQMVRVRLVKKRAKG